MYIYIYGPYVTMNRTTAVRASPAALPSRCIVPATALPHLAAWEHPEPKPKKSWPLNASKTDSSGWRDHICICQIFLNSRGCSHLNHILLGLLNRLNIYITCTSTIHGPPPATPNCSHQNSAAFCTLAVL